MSTITSVVLYDDIPVMFASTIPPLVLHDVVNATGSGVGSGSGPGSGVVPSCPVS